MMNGSKSGFKGLTRRGNNALNRSSKSVLTNEYWSAGIVRDRSAQPSSNVTAHIHETVSIEKLALAKARRMRSDCGSLLAWISRDCNSRRGLESRTSGSYLRQSMDAAQPACVRRCPAERFGGRVGKREGLSRPAKRVYASRSY